MVGGCCEVGGRAGVIGSRPASGAGPEAARPSWRSCTTPPTKPLLNNVLSRVDSSLLTSTTHLAACSASRRGADADVRGRRAAAPPPRTSSSSLAPRPSLA